MPRRIRDTNLEARDARLRLKRGRYHWSRTGAKGVSLGYRRGVRTAAWVVRHLVEPGRYAVEVIGAPDDHEEADGRRVLDFYQAQEEARRRASSPPERMGSDGYTVTACAEDYLEWFRAHRKSVADTEHRIRGQILPAFGSRRVAELTTREIERWHHKLAASAPRRRGRVLAFDPDDGEAVRRRRSTANRTLTTLKAMLNRAYVSGQAHNVDVWRRVRPFRGVDEARVRFLSHDECVRLINGAPGDFRVLLRAALLSGCRYGELCRMRVADFDPESATALVRVAKGGKSRRVYLTDEGVDLFDRLTTGRKGSELIFTKAPGEPWKHSEQARPMRVANERAGIDPPVSFHLLRHAYAALLAERGVPLQMIAIALGHADSRMAEKFYAHLQPDHVAATIRANVPSFSRVGRGKVRRLKARA